jgi:hypothetical protein
MQALVKALEIVRQAEAQLQQLLLRAAQQGDYETARVLAEWAKPLKQVTQQSDSVDVRDSVALANGKARVQAEAYPATVHKRTDAGKSPLRHKANRTKAARGEFPKFLRDGEELLKIGWSKREKKVYRHKAPKRVVVLVSESLQQAAQDGERFVMDQILPIRDRETDSDVPSYQAYLSLAWLRKEKLIVQHGRQGYSLRPETDLPNAVEERWNVLPKS